MTKHGFPDDCDCASEDICQFLQRREAREHAMTDPKNPAALPVIWRAIVDESTGYFINGEKGLLLNEVRLIQTGTAFVAAQAAIDELRAKLQEQALQALSDDGQWIEHTGKLQAEVERLTALVAALSLPGGEDGRDAARYRWLRDKSTDFAICEWKDAEFWQLDKSGANAWIDAAMSTNNLPGEGEKL